MSIFFSVIIARRYVQRKYYPPHAVNLNFFFIVKYRIKLYSYYYFSYYYNTTRWNPYTKTYSLTNLLFSPAAAGQPLVLFYTRTGPFYYYFCPWNLCTYFEIPFEPFQTRYYCPRIFLFFFRARKRILNETHLGTSTF